MKKGLFISLLLIALLTIIAVSFSGQAVLSYAQEQPVFEGSGNSSVSPYIIDSAAKLNAISLAVNQNTTISVNNGGVIENRYLDENTYYRVESDIDMTEYPSFTGIGTEDNPFSARLFDGGGYTIILNIDTTSDNVGLFGYYAVTTRYVNNIRDINIEGVVKSSGDNVGVFGYADFSLRRVSVSGIYVDGIINGANNVGIIGYLKSGVADSSITNSYNLALTYGMDSVGGIIGYKSYSNNIFSVNNCVVLGSVNGNRSGGIIGRVEQGSGSGGSYSVNAARLYNNFVKGSISGSNIGAIVGMHDDMLALYAESQGEYADYVWDNYYFTSDYVNYNLTGSGNLGNYSDELTSGAIAIDATVVSQQSSYSNDFLLNYEIIAEFPTLIVYPIYEKTPKLNSLNIYGGVQEYDLTQELMYVDNFFAGFTLELMFDYELSLGDTVQIFLNGQSITPEHTTEGYKLSFTEFFSDEAIIDGEQIIELSLNGGQRSYKIISSFSSDEGIEGTIITEGYGTYDYPYLIGNKEQLELVKDYPDKAYKLMDNIELTGDWTPIGDNSIPFSGVFMGNGYTISGINVVGGNYAGFFGYTSGAIITDINIDVDITGNSHVGGLIGYSKDTTVSNAQISGSVKATNNAGGVVGTIYNTYAVNYSDIICYASVYAAQHAGGIVGGFSSSTSRIFMTRVYQAGKVSMDLEASPNHSIAGLTYNYFGLFYGYQIKVGAESLITMNNSGAILNLYVKGSYDSINIFNANRGYEIVDTRVEGDYNVVSVKALFNGTIGTDAYTHYGCLSNYGGQFIRIAKPDNTYAYVAMLDRTTATFNTTVYIDLDTITSYNAGQLASLSTIEQGSKNYVVINTASEFEHLSWLINGYIYGESVAGVTYENIETNSPYAIRNIAGLSIKLAEDIDLTQSVGVYGDNNFYGIGWSSLMPYLGSLDGGGNSITINLNCPYGYQIGLLGAISSNAGGVSATASVSEIKNLNVYGSIVGHTVVGLIGIHDNYAPSIVFNHDRNSTVVVQNVNNYAQTTGVNIVGGLIGITQSTTVISENAKTPESFRPIRARIIESNNYGDVTANGNYGAGGLLGATSVAVASGISIENSANYGDVTSPKYTGGLVGRATCHIELKGANYNYGSIIGGQYTGGLAGYIELGLNVASDSYGVVGHFVNYNSVTGTSDIGLLYGIINDFSIDESEDAMFVGLSLFIGEETAGIQIIVDEDLYTTDTNGKVIIIVSANSVEGLSIFYCNDYMQPKEIFIDNIETGIKLPKSIRLAEDNITDSNYENWRIRVAINFYGVYEEEILDYSDHIDINIMGDELIFDYNLFEDSEYLVDLTVRLFRYSEEMYDYLDAFTSLNNMTEGSNEDYYYAVNDTLMLYNSLKAIYIEGLVSEDSKDRFIEFLEINQIEYYLLEEWLSLVAISEDISSLYDIEYNIIETIKEVVVNTLAGDISYQIKVYYEYLDNQAKAIVTHDAIALRKGEVITYSLINSFEIDIDSVDLMEFSLLSDYIKDSFIFDNTAKARGSVTVISYYGDELELSLLSTGDINSGAYEYYATDISGSRSAYYNLTDDYYVGELIIHKRALIFSYVNGEFIYNGSPQGVIAEVKTYGEYVIDSEDYALLYTGYTYSGDYYEATSLPIDTGMYKLTLIAGEDFYVEGISEVYFEIEGDLVVKEPQVVTLIVEIENVVYGQNLQYAVSIEGGGSLHCADYVIKFFEGDVSITHPRKVGDYIINIEPNAENVTFANNSAAFSILPKTLDLAYQKSFEYNGEIQKAVPELVGVVGLDDVYIEYIYTNQNSKDVGIYWATVTNIFGEDKDNYTLSSLVAEYTIINRELFASYAKTEFVYNGVLDAGIIIVDSKGRRVFDYEIIVEDEHGSYSSIPNIPNEYSLTVIPLDGVSVINNASINIAVNKAVIDNINFYSKNYIFNGEQRYLEVSTTYFSDGRVATVNYVGNGKAQKGEYIVEAIITDDLAYYEELRIFATLNINTANIATRISVVDYIYDRYPKTPDYTRDSFVEDNGGYKIRYIGIDNSYDSYVAPINAGSYRLVVSANSSSINIIDGIKDFCIQKRYVQVQMNASAQFTYCAEAVTYPTTLSGVLSGDFVKATLSYNDNSVAYNAGQYVVYVEGLAGLSASNYYTDIRSRSYNLVIVPKAITVTADNIYVTYGDEELPLTYTLSSPLLSDDVMSGHLSRDTGSVTGNYEIYQNSLTAGDNYAITYVFGLYVIKPRVFEIYIESDLEYCGYINKPFVNVGNILPSDASKSIYSIEYIGSFLDAGDYELKIRALDINYTVESNITVKSYTVTIAPKDVTSLIELNIPQKIYVSDGWYPQPVIYDALTDYSIEYYTITIYYQDSEEKYAFNQKGNYTLTISVNELNYTGQKSYDLLIREKVFDVPVVSNENIIIKHNSIQIIGLTDIEYSLDGITWSSDGELLELAEDSDYTIMIRYIDGVQAVTITCTTTLNPQLLRNALSALPQSFMWEHISLIRNAIQILAKTSEYEFEEQEIAHLNSLIEQYYLAMDRLDRELSRVRATADKITGRLDIHIVAVDLSMFISYLLIGLFMSRFGGVL